jgi:hypothetical protein
MSYLKQSVRETLAGVIGFKRTTLVHTANESTCTITSYSVMNRILSHDFNQHF